MFSVVVAIPLTADDAPRDGGSTSALLLMKPSLQ